MNDRTAFVDTNIVVYAVDRAQPEKSRVARELLKGLTAVKQLRLSTQVLQEAFVTLTRKVKKPASAEDALAYLDGLAVHGVFSPDYAAIREAALLHRDRSISFLDALIVVAAARSGAAVLYSEDLQHGQRLFGVEILNPFTQAAGKSHAHLKRP